MSMQGFASLEVGTLEDAVAQTCWTGAWKERIGMLSRTRSSSLKPLKEAAEGMFEVDVKAGEIRIFFDESIVLVRHS